VLAERLLHGLTKRLEYLYTKIEKINKKEKIKTWNSSDGIRSFIVTYEKHFQKTL
jgi:hypothetical protein